MNPSQPPISVAYIWERICSGVGYHLDNFARWLLLRAPKLGAMYAAIWAPGAPQLALRPGWAFAEEFYEQRQWTACRRGALWEAARDKDLIVPLIVKWHADTTVEVTLGNDNSLCLYVCGSFEPNEFSLFDRVLKPGMTFIDVGANDGYYTLFAARRVGSSGLVIAIEPSPRERGHLECNLVRNSLRNVQVLTCALGAAPGHARLRLAHGIHSGHNTLGAFAHDDVEASSSVLVKLETLDAVVAQHELSRVDVVKIDVEGAEASVIAGGRNVLTTMRPLLLLEVNDAALRAQQSSVEALLSKLQLELKYEIFVFSSVTGLPERLSAGERLSANVVAVPAEHAATFLTRRD